MKVYFDLDKRAITNVDNEDQVIFTGDVLISELQVISDTPTTDYYVTVSAKLSNGRTIGPFLYDENGVETDAEKTTWKYTLSSANGFTLVKGITNFYIWLMPVDCTNKTQKCLGAVVVNVGEAFEFGDDYFIAVDEEDETECFINMKAQVKQLQQLINSVTTIEANPNEAASTDLIKVKIGSVTYGVSVVKANQGTPTARLTKITIDGTTYKTNGDYPDIVAVGENETLGALVGSATLPFNCYCSWLNGGLVEKVAQLFHVTFSGTSATITCIGRDLKVYKFEDTEANLRAKTLQSMFLGTGYTSKDNLVDKQDKITSTNKVNADNVDDSSSINKFVTQSEKNTWNNKSDFSGDYEDLTHKPSIPIKTSDLTNDGNGTSKFALVSETGFKILFSLNPQNYVLTLNLYDKSNNVISQASVDLPLESIVTSATYYNTYTYDGTTYTKVIVLVLSTTSVPTIVPVGDLVSGLQTEITSQNKLEASLIQTDNDRMFVSNTEKNRWNNKSDFSGYYTDLLNNPIPVIDLNNDSTKKLQSVYTALGITGASDVRKACIFINSYDESIIKSNVVSFFHKYLVGASVYCEIIQFTEKNTIINAYASLLDTVYTVQTTYNAYPNDGATGQIYYVPDRSITIGELATYLGVTNGVPRIRILNFDSSLYERRTMVLYIQRVAVDTYNLSWYYLYQKPDEMTTYYRHLGVSSSAVVNTTFNSGYETIDLVNQVASQDITDTLSYKISGVSDGLALPSESQVEIVEVKGNSRVCSNLFNYTKVTNLENATLTNGTLTLIDTSIIGGMWFNLSDLNLSVGNTASFSFSPSTSQFQIAFYNGTTWLSTLNVNGTSASFTIPENCNKIYFILRQTGTTFTANNLMLNKGSTPLAYEPYFEGIKSSHGKVVDTGTNLFDGVIEAGSINTSTGANETSSDRWRSKNYLLVKASETITISNFGSGPLIEYDINKAFIKSTVVVDNQSITLSATTKYVRFYSASSNSNIQLNYGTTALAYQPYEEHEIALPELKSAGSVCDSIKGDKKIARIGSVDLGSLTWVYDASGYFAVTNFSSNYNAKAPASSSYVANILCAKYETKSAVDVSDSGLGIAITDWNALYVKDSNYTDATTFKTAMSGVMLNYELATPQEEAYEGALYLPCFYKGTEQQTSDVPYTLTRNYDISIKDQVLTNVKVDAQQQKQLDALTPVKLWENPNPSVVYPADVVPVQLGDLSKFKYLIVEYKDNMNGYGTSFQKTTADGGHSLMFIDGEECAFYSRKYAINKTSGTIDFGDSCGWIDGASSSDENQALIPVRIYGTNNL